MLIITESTYPQQSINEVVKCFKELPPLPEYITLRGPYSITDVQKGIKTIAIYEFDGSKYQEASEIINRRLAAYRDVPGMAWSANRWLDVQEALKTVGFG
jgi:hypothetical protein